MATLTIDDFIALKDCSIGGGVVPGLYTFETDDNGTGNNDWGTNCDVTTNPGFCTVTCPTGVDVFTELLNSPTANLVCRVKVYLEALIGEDQGQAMLRWYIDANNHGYIKLGYNAGGSLFGQLGAMKSGVLDAETIHTGLPYQSSVSLELSKTGSTWNGKFSFDDWSTETVFPSVTADISGGDLGIGGVGPAIPMAFRFENFEITEGFTATAEAQIRDTGVAYFDAGLNMKFDMSTAADSTTGTMTVDRRFDRYPNSGDTPSYGADVSLATYQGTADTDDRYQSQQIIISGISDGAVYDSFSIEAITVDITPPTDVSATIGALVNSDSVERLIGGWTNGTDSGGAGWKGTTFEIEIDSTWRTLNDSSEVGESLFTLTSAILPENRVYIGDASEECSIAIDAGDDAAITTLSDITRLRFTSYDLADNTSVVTVTVSTSVGDLPEVYNVLDVDTVDGVQGTLTLPSDGSNILTDENPFGVAGSSIVPSYDESLRNTDPLVANVLTGVTYKIQGDDKVGTFSPTSDPAESGSIAFKGVT